MKYAERTMDLGMGPFLGRIQKDLRALGVQPENPTPNPDPSATPIPSLPDGHAIPPPETYVKYTNGTGPLRLEPGEVHYLHFYAPLGFEYERVSILRSHIIGGVEGLNSNIELLIPKTWAAGGSRPYRKPG